MQKRDDLHPAERARSLPALFGAGDGDRPREGEILSQDELLQEIKAEVNEAMRRGRLAANRWALEQYERERATA